MAISLVRPVPEQWPITGEYLQTDSVWTPERPHLGVDFGCPTGTTVRSVTQRAMVVAVHRQGDGWGDGSFGINIVMDVLGTEWYYIYAHLSEALVAVGQTIEPGQTIAMSGATGFVTGAHLHVQACTSRNFPRDPALMGDPILGLRNQQPQPEPEPQVVAEITAQEAAEKAAASLAATVRLNAAIMLRGGINRIAFDSDFSRVEQAAEALRKAGFQL